MTAERWFPLAGCVARWQLLERELGEAGGGGGWEGGAASVPALPSPCCKPSSLCQAWAAPRGSLTAAGGALCQRDPRTPRDRDLQTTFV